MQRVSAWVVGLMLAASSASAAPILGDWTQGFLSDYTLNDASQWAPGVYGWTENHGFWMPATGAPAGPTMFVNGRDDRDSVVWAKSIEAEVGSSLNFSGWFGNLCCTEASGLHYPGPILSLWLDDLKLADLVTDGPGVMQLFGASFIALGGPMTLSIRNQSTVFDGNDFAMSGLDVTNTPTPEPASLLLLGAGLLGIARRAKRLPGKESRS